MSERPLTATLGATFRELVELAARHHDAEAYSAARERLSYVHDRLRALARALRTLRGACGVLLELGEDQAGAAIWRQTCAELRMRAPATIRAPGQAIIGGGLDLLQLVEYTGAALALTNERREQVVAQIARTLERASDRHDNPMVGITLQKQVSEIIDAMADGDSTDWDELAAAIRALRDSSSPNERAAGN